MKALFATMVYHKSYNDKRSRSGRDIWGLGLLYSTIFRKTWIYRRDNMLLTYFSCDLCIFDRGFIMPRFH
jgi:hypothetical protein